MVYRPVLYGSRLRGRLSSTYISLPCDVVLYGEQDLVLTAPARSMVTPVNLEETGLNAAFVKAWYAWVVPLNFR